MSVRLTFKFYSFGVRKKFSQNKVLYNLLHKSSSSFLAQNKMVHFLHCVDYTTFILEMIPFHDRGKSE